MSKCDHIFDSLFLFNFRASKNDEKLISKAYRIKKDILINSILVSAVWSVCLCDVPAMKDKIIKESF